MSDELNSQLSAFIDDELTPEESELFVRRLCRDETLRQTAACYAIIGDALRGEPAVTAPSEFASAVMMALEGQTVPVVRAQQSKLGRPLPHWGFALAASVALAAVILMALPSRGPDGLDTVVAEATPPVAIVEQPRPVSVAETDLPTSRPDFSVASSGVFEYNVPVSIPASAENRARLNNLLLQHLSTSGAMRQPAGFRNVGFYTQTESDH